MFVRNDSKSFRFCSSKCHKNFKFVLHLASFLFPVAGHGTDYPTECWWFPGWPSIGWSETLVNWNGLKHSERLLERRWLSFVSDTFNESYCERDWFRLCRQQDSTLNFEKRRNIPIPYDRDLVQATVKGMKRIAEISAKREKAFYKAR